MKTLKYEKRQIKIQWGKTPFIRNVAQTGGAVGCRPTGRGFKSHRSDSPPNEKNLRRWGEWIAAETVPTQIRSRRIYSRMEKSIANSWRYVLTWKTNACDTIKEIENKKG